MSVESARAFINKVRTDQKFAQKLLEFTNYAEAQAAFIEASGFDFTIEEFTDEMMNHANHITDDELHMVARAINKYIKIGEE